MCYTLGMYDLSFPHLGIIIEKLPRAIYIGNFSIAFYGMIIGIGIIIGLLLSMEEAKRTGQNPDDYADYIIWGIIGGVVGARLYYVLFELEYYLSNPIEIFNLRSGGLAIYGAVIGAFAALFIWCRIKKKRPLLMLDTMVPQLVLAQGLGRWGNFFNMEAFGRYTDGLFAMRLKKSMVSPIMMDAEQLQKVITINGTEYIQAIPTFFIESIWCILIFVFLFIMRKHKKFEGQLLSLYIGLYGIERAIVEGLRTDSLMLGSLRVSQILAIICVILAIVMYFVLKKLDLKPEANADGGEKEQQSEE